MASSTATANATNTTTEMVSITTTTTPNHVTGGDIETGTTGNHHTTTTATATTTAPTTSSGQGFLKPLPETTLLERVAGLVAVVAIATAVAAAIIEQSVIVIIGAILSSVIGPYCYYQQTKLTDIRTLQETKTAITEEVNQLTLQNQRLMQNITNLTCSVDRLEEIEQALQVLTQTQGQNIDVFQQQVTQNQQLLVQMKQNVKANVLQNLLSVILRSDTNQDMIMNDSEITTLMRRLQNIAGVECINETKFRSTLQNQSISNIMTIIQNVLQSPDLPPSERIFTFKNDTNHKSNTNNTTASGTTTSTATTATTPTNASLVKQ